MKTTGHIFAVLTTVVAVCLLAGVAGAGIVQLGSYGLGEPGTVGASAPFTPLADSILPANNITGFQNAGGPVAIATTGLAAPGSTAALQLTQNSGRNTGWHSTSPSYGLANDWALQLWLKTPDSTGSGNSYVFAGLDGNAANTLSLELNNGTVNLLRDTDTATRVTGFAYTADQWFRTTLISYNGQLQLYQGTGVTPTATTSALPTVLGDLRLGFGKMAPGGRGASATFDEMKVWSFDHTADTLAQVKTAVGLGGTLPPPPPEPTIIKPVSVSTTIAGDAGSSHLYLLDDNPSFAAPSLQRPVGTGVTLNTGDLLSAAMATVHERSGGGHAESWTRSTELGLPEFVFDLTGGGDTAVESIILWQYGNNGGGPGRIGNATKDFRVILHSEAEGNVFNFSTETADIDDIMQAYLDASTASNIAQLFSFPSVQNARYAAVRIDDNYLGEPGIIAGGDRYGLGEVRFVAPAPSGDIPEPASALLVMLAVPAVAARLRRRMRTRS